jgi:hypothetical protein
MVVLATSESARGEIRGWDDVLNPALVRLAQAFLGPLRHCCFLHSGDHVDDHLPYVFVSGLLGLLHRAVPLFIQNQ